MSNKWFYIHALNLILVYIVGIYGLAFTDAAQQKIFLQLTPVSLIISILVAGLFHTSWNRKFIFSILFIFLFGFFIEVIGVKTKLIFGTYWYGKTLGFKLFDVPVLIGLNWFLLVYVIATTLYKIKNHFLFAFLGASVMTFLDFLIEPIAIKLDFWEWQNSSIPIDNYVAWFIISYFLFFLFRSINGKIKNRISIIIVVTQFLFFILLNSLLK